jgi:hypothetical protein
VPLGERVPLDIVGAPRHRVGRFEKGVSVKICHCRRLVLDPMLGLPHAMTVDDDTWGKLSRLQVADVITNLGGDRP